MSGIKCVRWGRHTKSAGQWVLQDRFENPWSRECENTLTCAVQIAGCMHLPDEQLQPDDGIDDDDEEYKQSNVQQRNHGFNDGVQHYL